MAFSPRQTANPFRIRNTKTHHRFRPIHEFFDTLILSPHQRQNAGITFFRFISVKTQPLNTISSPNRNLRLRDY
jgi:hypothetical protein